MKKTFSLTAPNRQPDRQVEYVKYQIRKYVARERRKALPEGAHFWDFQCKIGIEAPSAVAIHVGEINKKIDEVVLQKAPSFYLEILAKPGIGQKRSLQE